MQVGSTEIWGRSLGGIIRIALFLLVLYAFPLANAQVRVESEPPGAKVYLDGTLRDGTTPMLIQNVSDGYHNILIELSEFHAYSTKIQTRKSEQTEVFAELQPKFGVISVYTNPEADIYIDDKKVGFGTCFKRVSSGTHVISARLEKHDIARKSIIIEEGSEYREALAPEPITGAISVKAFPADCEVFLNNENKGKSPLVIQDLLIGDFNINLQKSGYRSIKRNISVRRNETTLIRDTLIKGGIKLTIVSNPGNAGIYIDNRFVGASPYSKIIPSGEHDIRVNMENYKDHFETTTFTRDITRHIDLQKDKTLIRFNSTPSNAEVSINGSPLCKSGSSARVEFGLCNIEMNKSGFTTEGIDLLVDKKLKQVNLLMYPEKYRKKPPAIILSALFPGAGQSYLNRGSWHPVFGVLTYGMIGGWYYYDNSTLNTYNQYINETDSNIRENLKDQWQTQQSISRACLAGAGAVWLANMIWTLSMNDEQSRYRKLELSGSFDNVTKTGQLGVKLKLK